jgi:phosphoadenosine phosphosulfate reductase
MSAHPHLANFSGAPTSAAVPAHDVKLFGDQIAASRLETRFARLKAASLVRLVIEDLYPGRVALVSSFGADAAALLHMVSKIDKTAPVVFVDTGQHFPETLDYRDRLVETLGLTNVIVAEPRAETIAEEDPEKFLFASDPDRCCEIRKVRPLAEAIGGYDAWITGRKGFQTATRATLPLFEAEGDRIKVNPLVGWSAKDVLDYISEAGLPRHPLVAKGFPSIGCLPCTSAVRPGEDGRAGRWRGRGKIECGIHLGALDAGADI